MSPSFDLQSHSLHSDGELPAAEVVAAASAAGVEVLSLTDHDTVDGVGEALTAGREHGVGIVTGVEISALDPGPGDVDASNPRDLHILGYGVDHEDAVFAVALERFRADRDQRADRMVQGLRDCGFQLELGELERRRAAGLPIGRPHLAAAVVAHGANAARLREERLHNPSDVLVRYLLPGAPAFRNRSIPTVGDAIAAIHRAGGLAVWAHPFWDIDDAGEVAATLERFTREHALDGVEAFYVGFSEPQTRLLTDTAARLGLLTSGSTDFHGAGHDRFNGFAGFETYGIAPNVERILALAA